MLIDQNVRFWPLADDSQRSAHICCQGLSGDDRLRHQPMSAFAGAIGGKADIVFCGAHVRFRPEADMEPTEAPS